MNKAFEKILERLDKAIKECKELQRNTDDAYGYMKMKKGLVCAKGIVEEVARECNVGWIPCSERLPDDDIEVLVWFEYYRYGEYNRLYRTIGISYIYNGEWSGFVNGSSGWRDLSIIAWQPLPEPYKESD